MARGHHGAAAVAAAAAAAAAALLLLWRARRAEERARLARLARLRELRLLPVETSPTVMLASSRTRRWATWQGGGCRTGWSSYPSTYVSMPPSSAAAGSQRAVSAQLWTSTH